MEPHGTPWGRARGADMEEHLRAEEEVGIWEGHIGGGIRRPGMDPQGPLAEQQQPALSCAESRPHRATHRRALWASEPQRMYENVEQIRESQ